MKPTVKVSWSGGKDSTCAVLLHLEAGHKVKAVNYTPMFTEEIPLLLKDHYEFIQKTAERVRDWGAEVYMVTGMTYCDYVLRRKTKGADKGGIMGFPCFIPRMCKFKNFGKIKELKSCDVGCYDYEDIGIAYDEKKRQTQLNEKLRSILVEYEITEQRAMEICKHCDLLSPLYEHYKRDGCTLCPNAPKREREQWFREYPEAVPILKELQDKVRAEKPEQSPLRNHEWFLQGGQNEE